jgi:hypothetical protein
LVFVDDIYFFSAHRPIFPAPILFHLFPNADYGAITISEQ